MTSSLRVFAVDMYHPEREGSQDDTMCSPPPALLPTTCAPPAKRRVSLHTAPPSLLPQVALFCGLSILWQRC